MNVVRKGVRLILLRLVPRFRGISYRARAKFDNWLAGGEIRVDVRVKFNVPVRCDGAGKVILCERVSLGYSSAPRTGKGEILIQARSVDSIIKVGSNTSTSNNISLVAMQSIRIGKDCLIGDHVAIYDSDFHEIDPTTRNQSTGISAPVVIADNVWIGSRVMVLKGVKIGRGSVIAAGSVVVRNIPENVIAAGIPAKVIRSIK